MTAVPLRAQNILSTLLGDGVGLSLNSGLLDLSLLGQSAETNPALLSLDVLSGDALLGVGLSGQDILLLGAPAPGQGMPLDGLMPLLDAVVSDQDSVIEFLADSALSDGAVEPPVLTISLPGLAVDSRGQPRTVDNRQDQRSGERVSNGSVDNLLQLPGACQDKDEDSVCDALDQCPTSPPGAIVLPSGCHLDVEQALELQGVTFAVDTALLTASSADVLRQAAKILKGLDAARVEVAGHTDDTGNAQYNMALSRKRALAVRAFLVNEGVDPRRLVARGYGAGRPKLAVAGLEGAALELARGKNRRVELRVLSSSSSPTQ